MDTGSKANINIRTMIQIPGTVASTAFLRDMYILGARNGVDPKDILETYRIVL